MDDPHDDQTPAPLLAGIALLERSLTYTLGSLHLVTPAALDGPTPCHDWPLNHLLTHLTDSLTALHEAATLGEIPLLAIPSTLTSVRGKAACGGAQVPRNARMAGPAREGGTADGGGVAGGVDALVGVRQAACGVVGAWTNLVRRGPVAVGDYAMTAAVVAAVGAVEVAVHGWDVARSCGVSRPMPVSLAEELLDLAMLFVTAPDRPGRFAVPVKVPPGAPAQDRLLGFLGRPPEWHAGRPPTPPARPS
jgi:uncharacterized protein (TIGR03086 family)